MITENNDNDDTKVKVPKNIYRAAQLRKRAYQLDHELDKVLPRWVKNDSPGGPAIALRDALLQIKADLIHAASMYERLPEHVMVKRREAKNTEFEEGMFIRPKPKKMADYSGVAGADQHSNLEVLNVSGAYVRVRTDNGSEFISPAIDFELRIDA